VLILSWKNYALSVVPFCNALLNLLELEGILREMSQLSVPLAPGASPSPSGMAARLKMRFPVGRRMERACFSWH
jgi:hypothetical protein